MNMFQALADFLAAFQKASPPASAPAPTGNDNLDAVIMCIRACEGTLGDEGWRALFGYRPGNGVVFSDFSRHPNVLKPFKNSNGATQYSSAAGALQINYPSWQTDPQPDFTPASQTQWAVNRINRSGAMPDIEAGRLQSALDRLAPIWASLPASTYPQPKRTYAFAQQAYVAAGGKLA